ncbi:MAG: nucleotidyltransferase family protein [bacterium]|nr:nucleotidyltransferase family protein [bacterium]
MIDTLIILAGGKSTRFKDAGFTIPKFLLPIYNTHLLNRQIAQAKHADIKKIIISTHPDFFPQITNLSGGVVEVVSNQHHDEGPFAALANVVHEKKIKKSFFCSLADIYFIDNPFVKQNHTTETTLFFSKPVYKQELTLGGIGFVTGNKVEKIVKSPIPNNEYGLRWNGLSIISFKHQDILAKYVNKNPGEFPPEDFFLHLLSLGETVRQQDSVDFVNNNTTDDLFLSELYNFSENLINPEKARVISLAKKFRKKLLI